MVYNISKAYVQIRSRFSVRARRKCINFSQITVATTAVDIGNGVFQTSLDFEKNQSAAEPFNAFFENSLP